MCLRCHGRYHLFANTSTSTPSCAVRPLAFIVLESTARLRVDPFLTEDFANGCIGRRGRRLSPALGPLRIRVAWLPVGGLAYLQSLPGRGVLVAVDWPWAVRGELGSERLVPSDCAQCGCDSVLLRLRQLLGHVGAGARFAWRRWPALGLIVRPCVLLPASICCDPAVTWRSRWVG